MNELAVQEITAIEAAIFANDISKLDPQQRGVYLAKVAETSGLNPLTHPFQIIKLNGKDVLYATKGAAQQLAKRWDVSIKVTKLEIVDGCIECHVEGTMGNRTDVEIGSVPYSSNMAPADKANAKMKVLTKAKRRLILSMCGLGCLDESEMDTIPASAMKPVPVEQPAPLKDVTSAAVPAAVPAPAPAPAYKPEYDTVEVKRMLGDWWKAFHAEQPEKSPTDFYALVASSSYGGDWIPVDKLDAGQLLKLANVLVSRIGGAK